MTEEIVPTSDGSGTTPSFTASFVPTSWMAYLASRTIMLSTISCYWIYLVILIAPIAIVAYAWSVGFPITSPLRMPLIGPLPFWLTISLLALWLILVAEFATFFGIRSSLKTSVFADREHRYTFSEEGLRIQTKESDFTLSWSGVQKVKQSRSFFLFFYSKKCAYYMPSDRLDEDKSRQLFDWHAAAS